MAEDDRQEVGPVIDTLANPRVLVAIGGLLAVAWATVNLIAWRRWVAATDGTDLRAVRTTAPRGEGAAPPPPERAVDELWRPAPAFASTGQVQAVAPLPEPEPEPDLLVLRPVDTDLAPIVVESTRPVLLGRSKQEADRVLAMPDVSRRHCRIRTDAAGRFVVQDLGSTNGTWVNGTATPEGALHPIEPGDVLTVGRTVRFRVEPAPRRRAISA